MCKTPLACILPKANIEKVLDTVRASALICQISIMVDNNGKAAHGLAQKDHKREKLHCKYDEDQFKPRLTVLV